MTSYTNALHSDSQTISLFHLYVRDPTLYPCIADLQPLTHLDTLFINNGFCGIRSVTQLCLSLIVIFSKPSCISS